MSRTQHLIYITHSPFSMKKGIVKVRALVSGSLLLVCLFIIVSPAHGAGTVNRTIDDSNQSVIYAPEGVWSNQNCGGCAIKPNVLQAFDGTYTAATYHPQLEFVSIGMQFSGKLNRLSVGSDQLSRGSQCTV